MSDIDAETLRAVVGQIGTLVLDHSGQVLSATGQLKGEHVAAVAAKTVLSLLQDAGNVLDAKNKETLERIIVNFPTYDFVITHDSDQIYVVKRAKSPQAE